MGLYRDYIRGYVGDYVERMEKKMEATIEGFRQVPPPVGSLGVGTADIPGTGPEQQRAEHQTSTPLSTSYSVHLQLLTHPTFLKLTIVQLAFCRAAFPGPLNPPRSTTVMIRY